MDQDKLIIESYKKYLPSVKNWINTILKQHFSEVKFLSEFGFKRLQQYYSKDILDSVKVVIVDKPPMVPLSSLGLKEFRDFENLDAAGVTYLDTYFLRSDYANLESIHFHELVHIIQWEHLGIDKFLLMYGLGLLKYEYKNNPLESLAYKLQEDFEKTDKPRAIEKEIIFVLDEMAASLFS